MALTNSDLKKIEQIVTTQVKHIVSTKVDPIAKDLKDVNGRVKKIERNIELIVGFFDEQDTKLSKRVAKIEKHLGLPQN